MQTAEQQPTEPESEIYYDPYDKKLCQFRTACNDGFLNGGCPFALLFNLPNVDDKALVPSWLAKKPQIIWTMEGKKGEPGTCVRSTRLEIPPMANTISTCLAVQENLNVAAVGFSNHCLILLRGDITRDRGTKQKMLLAA